MKIKLATFYMETVWIKLGSLRGTKVFHKLFNIAYGCRKEEYLAQIMALPQN
jgi:hypothetical protein